MLKITLISAFLKDLNPQLSVVVIECDLALVISSVFYAVCDGFGNILDYLEFIQSILP